MAEMSDRPPIDVERDLLFGALALQADYINSRQFVDACAVWTSRKNIGLPELLMERHVLTAEGMREVERLLIRKLAKHRGDPKAALGELKSDSLQRTLATVEDPYVNSWGNDHGHEYYDDGHGSWSESGRRPGLRAWFTNNQRVIKPLATVIVLLAVGAGLLMLPGDKRPGGWNLFGWPPQAKGPIRGQPTEEEIKQLRMQRAEQLRDAEARRVVQNVFRVLARKADVIEHLEKDPCMNEQVRKLALEFAERFPCKADELNNASWYIVRVAGVKPYLYELAVAMAEDACRLEPRSGFYINTLGVAQYRAGKYEQAAVTLEKSDQLNRTPKGSIPADAAFLAMTYHKLGRKEKAKEAMARLTETMEKTDWLHDAEMRGLLEESKAFFAEAEKTLKSEVAVH
jgi:tetratricopeptide (TPR) repeat protein